MSTLPSERQAKLIWFAVSAVAATVLMGLLALLVWAASRLLEILGPVLWPLAIAGVLAYLLDPVVDALERRRIPRARAILVVFGLAVGVVLAGLGSVVPQMVVESRQLLNEIPHYRQRAQRSIERWATNPPPLLRELAHMRSPASSLANTNATGETNGISQDPAEPIAIPAGVEDGAERSSTLVGSLLGEGRLQQAGAWVANALPKVGTWLFGQLTKVASWFGFLAGIALVPIYLFYFLLEKRGIESRWTDYLPVKDSAFKEELVFVLSSINDYLIAFFRGQVLVAICDGILYTIGFLIIGLPYAVLLGVVATFLTVIPFLGAIVTCVSAIVIALVQFGDFKHPLMVLAVFAVVQNLEGFVIQPKIVGDRVGLHPVVIIIALMVGTTLLGGLLGGLLAIPLAAALRVLMFRYVWRAPSGEGRAPS